MTSRQPPDFRLVHRIADALVPELRDAFLAAFETLRNTVGVNALTELLEAADLAGLSERLGALRLEPDDLKQVRAILEDALRGTGTVTAAELNLDFRLVSPLAVRWAEQHAGQLIVGVSEETRLAIRGIVERGLLEGRAPRVQALEIRRLVGLTVRDATAVDNFLRAQLDDGVPLERAQRLADAMRDRLLRARALNIARTETIRAANMGQQLAWQTGVDQGLLPRTVRKVWIVTPDSRLCVRCSVMDGAVVDLGEPFVATRQAASESDIVVSGGSVSVKATKPLSGGTVTTLTPPLHPGGRCAIGLEFD